MPFCPTCGEYAFNFIGANAKHLCPPEWEGRLESDGDEWGCFGIIRARYAEDAAAKFAEKHDDEGHLARDENHTERWRIRRFGSPDAGEVFQCSATVSVNYQARPAPHAD